MGLATKRIPILPQTLKETNNSLTICSWNIKQGLIKREEELKDMLKSECIDIVFLMETDNKNLEKESDFQVEGYKTVFHKRKDHTTMLRMMCLISKEVADTCLILDDLMSDEIPSVWIEIKEKDQTKTAIGAFYREWTHNGIKTEAEQMKNMGLFCKQIDKCSNKYNNSIILGDMNLCSEKWKEVNYIYKNVSSILINTLEQCGMNERKLGTTFTADGLNKNGEVVMSSIDHIYVSIDMEEKTKTSKLLNSSSDHLPIVAKIERNRTLAKKFKTITKRCTKNFNKKYWCETLNKIQASKTGESGKLEDNVLKLEAIIEEALNTCAPIKTFKVRENHKFGISERTKALIKERDMTRHQIKDKSPTEKAVLHQKYKRLRNKVNSMVKNDTIKYNDERVDKAANENEMWKIVKEVTSPKNDTKWSLIEDGKLIDDEIEVAEVFNDFFINKIKDIKTNIDSSKIEDPIRRMKEKLKDRKLHFSLKTVSEKDIEKAIDGLKTKKSAGADNLTQEQMKLGCKEIVKPLTKIINQSITEGIFPEAWKIAIVTPVLKKGCKTEKSNYRPVSCLMVLSKVLEKVVCGQVTEFMEKNDLFPENQHGFREHRSTMSAHANIQQEWTQNTENKLITGVLLWDLSAAFDCLDCEILCQKLEVYGFCVKSVNWFRSFLTGRSQQVKIKNTLSSSRTLVSGAPQGGILSPILFVIYGADLEEWLHHSVAHTYADDTKSSVTGKSIEEVKVKLETDAIEVLKFMASNGLKANSDKTTLMIINYKSEENVEIQIDNSKVTQEKSAKLLGIMVEDNLKWNNQIRGKGGVIPALNTRLYLIKRMKNKINVDRLRKVANSIWSSKLRYGLQLYAKVRMNLQDQLNPNIEKLQVAQNKLARVLENVNLSDKMPTKTLLANQKMLSVNQTAAQIKLSEVWKAINIKGFPIKVKKQMTTQDARITRGVTFGKLIEEGSSKLTINSFVGDAIRLWNNAPEEIKKTKSIYSAKLEINKFVMTLPI